MRERSERRDRVRGRERRTHDVRVEVPGHGFVQCLRNGPAEGREGLWARVGPDASLREEGERGERRAQVGTIVIEFRGACGSHLPGSTPSGSPDPLCSKC